MSGLPPNLDGLPPQRGGAQLNEEDLRRVTYFTFMPHQSRLVRRMAERCRQQHGMLLIHSMGSGKTISSLGVWLNFPRPDGSGMEVKNRLVIITPPGLDSAFREDMGGMGFDEDKIASMVRHQRLVFVDYADIEHGMVTDKGERMSMTDTMEFLVPLLKDSFIIADEAHNFVAILKKWARQEKQRLYTKLLDAFNGANKVILLSGTPLQREWNDLTILASLAAGYQDQNADRKLPVYPTYQSQINITYPVDWSLGLWIRQKFLEDPTVVATIASTTGIAMGLFALPTALVGATLMGGIGMVYSATKGQSGFFGGLARMALGAVTGVTSSFTGDVPQFSIDKMADDIAKHVSYFNYTDLDFHLTENFPLKQLEPVPVRYSPFQLDMYLKQSRLEDVLDDMELQFTGRLQEGQDAFKLGESVKVATNNMDHYRRMRVIGNLSEDNYYYTTIRAPTADGFGNRLYYIFPRYKDTPVTVEDFSRGFSSDGVVRSNTAINDAMEELMNRRKDIIKEQLELSEDDESRAFALQKEADALSKELAEKFHPALVQALSSYATTYIAHKQSQYHELIPGHTENLITKTTAGLKIEVLQKQRQSILETLPKKNKEEATAEQRKTLEELEKHIEEIGSNVGESVNLFRLHNMDSVVGKRAARMTFATNKFITALQTLCQERTKYHYLPIFYSNFDEYGFRAFSAFLTQRGYYHILIDPFDDPGVRKSLITLGNLPYRRYRKVQRSLMDYEPMDYEDEDPDVVARLNLDRNRYRANENDIAPLCVLLHPLIVEGLSFNLSPSIVVNESVDGYGRAEQLYARILRAIRGHGTYDSRKLVQKAINDVMAEQKKKNPDAFTLFSKTVKDRNPNINVEKLRQLYEDRKVKMRYREDLANQLVAEHVDPVIRDYILGLWGRYSGLHLEELARRMVKAARKDMSKPPKTTAECVAEGFYGETEIPDDFPRMIVRENVVYKTVPQSELATDTNRYSIELLDKSEGFVLADDYCSDVKAGGLCRSPVYVELDDDYTLKRCKKKVFLLQATFGKWTLFTKEQLQALGEWTNLEPLKDATDLSFAVGLPPVIDITARFVASSASGLVGQIASTKGAAITASAASAALKGLGGVIEAIAPYGAVSASMTPRVSGESEEQELSRSALENARNVLSRIEVETSGKRIAQASKIANQLTPGIQTSVAGVTPGRGLTSEAITSPAQVDFLRYFMDKTYPGGFLNIADPTRTNEFSSTETPDEVVEKYNRVNMFDWKMLADSLKKKFASEDAIFCDAQCVGQCMWKGPSEETEECYPWLQQKINEGQQDMFMGEPGTCHKQERLSTLRNSSGVPERAKALYGLIERSTQAQAKWRKHRDQLAGIKQTMKDANEEEQNRLAMEADVGAFGGVHYNEEMPNPDIAIASQNARKALNEFYKQQLGPLDEDELDKVVAQHLADAPEHRSLISRGASSLGGWFYKTLWGIQPDTPELDEKEKKELEELEERTAILKDEATNVETLSDAFDGIMYLRDKENFKRAGILPMY